MTTPLKLTQDLIKCPSVTPDDNGAQDLIKNLLAQHGFTAHDISVNGVTNTYLHKGTQGPLIFISGHTDVVPPGNLEKWNSAPFSPLIIGKKLFGRGSCDMKGSIAAMTCALMEFSATDCQVAFGLTSDEEGASIDGSRQIAKWMCEQNQRPACTLVIEPTCHSNLGDTIKNGRRGSLYLDLNISTEAAHVAYLPSEENVMLKAARLIQKLQQSFTQQNVNFHLVKLQAGDANNMTPSSIHMVFNWRFATNLSVDEIMKITKTHLDELEIQYQSNWEVGAEPYDSPPGHFGKILTSVITSHCDIQPEYSQSGGASDARFFAPFSDEVIEFGPCNESIHKPNENINIDHLDQLKSIYLNWLQQIASSQSKYLNATGKSAACST